jgi:peptidyl-prolyl cis-trans isomerase D
VIDEVTMRAKQEKKAQQFLKEFNDYLASAKTPSAMAEKMKLPVEKANDLLFNSYSVAGVGKEDQLCGALPVLKENVASKPIRGNNSAYVVWLISKTPAPAVKDYKAAQQAANMTLASRADYEAFEAMKTIAEIEDHKAKFDF